MAPGTSPQRRVSPVARVPRFRGDDPLLEEYKPLRRLERGTRWVGPGDGPVNQWLVGVSLKLSVVGPEHLSGQQRRVIRRRGYHTEDLPRGRLDHHDAAYFILQQQLTVCLQLDIDAQGEVFSRYRCFVVCPLLVASLHPAVRVPKKYFHPFLAAQILLVR